MNKYVVIEINAEGEKQMLDGEYDAWEEACEAQEAMEWLHDENNYLIYTADEWMYEVENGRG